MKQVNEKTLYFYSSKIKNTFMAIMCVLLVILGIAVFIGSFEVKDYGLGLLGIFITFFFSWLTIFLIKKIIVSEPYLILTEEALMIDAPLKSAIPLKWEDIEWYEVEHMNFNTIIEFVVSDEEKYKEQMSNIRRKLNSITTMGGKYSTFTIAINQVKKKDRHVLYYALDHIHTPEFDLTRHEKSNKVKRANESFQLADKITKKYFLKTYGLSLFLVGFTSLLFYWSDDLNERMPLIIASFFLFPFAKVLFDAIIGFKLNEKEKKQTYIFLYFYQLIYFVYLLLFLFSFFIAPFGILFLIVRAVYRFFKKNDDMYGT